MNREEREAALADDATARARTELEAAAAIVDALDPIKSRESRLRILGAVALLHGSDDVARDCLRSLAELREEEMHARADREDAYAKERDE
jgi:hypothetical protein